MDSTIDFVGLVYFHHDGDKRIVLLPDGTNPENELIPAHHAAIDIASPDFVDAIDWPEDPVPQPPPPIFSRRFVIPEKASITITGLRGKGVDAASHDGLLPALGLRVDPAKADTIARLTVSNGTLKAFRLPDMDGARGAVVSQVTVPTNGDPVTITARSGRITRTLIAAAGAEIVISNISNVPDEDDGENGHFQIFRKLAPAHDAPLAPPVSHAKLDTLRTTHPFFARPENHPSEPCSNGCC
jgi:hypothetical protein